MSSKLFKLVGNNDESAGFPTDICHYQLEAMQKQMERVGEVSKPHIQVSHSDVLRIVNLLFGNTLFNESEDPWTSMLLLLLTRVKNVISYTL